MVSFEFANNEMVTAVECVLLETLSAETGSKNFIAVGTSINRGEDLATKGCVSWRLLLICVELTFVQTYIFEITEVVPDVSAVNAPKRWYRLRLLCRDEAKGPITALCGFEGYLVSSMGQKVWDGLSLEHALD